MPNKPDKDYRRLEELAEKWLNSSLSAEEEIEFNTWYDGFVDNEITDYSEAELQRLENKLYRKIQLKNIKYPLVQTKKITKTFVWAAASITLCVAIAGYLYLQQTKAFRTENTQHVFAQIEPGSNQAILRMDNGAQFNLSSLHEGEVYEANGLQIQKLDEGALVYHQRDDLSHTIPIQNTLRTPSGGQFKVTLSDGTEVWLNAESEITFPSIFNGAKREVALKGEAYFNVSHNADMPFIVKTADQAIKVLGTQFNVNAYANEGAIKTTLVSGKVEVTYAGQQYTLNPGQQAIAERSMVQLHPVNVAQYTAWKDGLFIFDKDNLQTILRQFSRWYNIDVQYAVERRNDRFVGEISRQSNLDEALRILRLGGVVFRIEQSKDRERPLLIVEK